MIKLFGLQQCLGRSRPEPYKPKCFSNYFLCTQNAETHWANKVLQKGLKFAQKATRRGSLFYLISHSLLRTHILGRNFQAQQKRNCCKSRVPTINLNSYKRSQKNIFVRRPNKKSFHRRRTRTHMEATASRWDKINFKFDTVIRQGMDNK